MEEALAAKLASTTTYRQAPHAFNTTSGQFEINYDWRGLPGQPTLKWVPGNMFWESENYWCHKDHITLLSICLWCGKSNFCSHMACTTRRSEYTDISSSDCTFSPMASTISGDCTDQHIPSYGMDYKKW
ncbi:hypothetical protein BsWGS_20303 [Bradybaena similaris]